MDWVTKAALIAKQQQPSLSTERAFRLADDLYFICEPEMGPAEAVYRFFLAMPPGRSSTAVPLMQ